MNVDVIGRKVALEKILGNSSSIVQAEDDAQFCLKADEILLSFVLDKAGVRLADHTNRTLIEELSYWDRAHLGNLAKNINHYVQEPSDREKLAYLIAHSIRDDLTDSLASGNQDDQFSAYNANVISALNKSRINVAAWMEHGGNLKHTPSLNPANPFYIEAVQWRRDFRSDFAIGDLSNCCITVGDSNQGDMYRKILLDYFLDLSVQVIHLKKVALDEEQKIGQIYFVGLSLPNEKPVLGVTSVELNLAHRDDLDLVPPISKIILAEHGYQESYRFESVIVGHRFNSFRSYLGGRRKEISNMISSILKQKRQNLTKEKSMARQNGLPTVPFQEKIDTIDREVEALRSIVEGMYTPTWVQVKKSGLGDAIKADQYHGTDYLDLFESRSTTQSYHSYDRNGFFKPKSPPNRVHGYHIYGEGLFDRIESLMNAIKIKHRRKNKIDSQKICKF